MAADIGTLTPEQMLQQQQILRQQKMAEMLMQQPAPQGQMIGNRYVAPSFTQNLANLANMYVGQRAIEKGDQAQIDLAKAIREQQKVGLADYYQTLKGTPEVQGGIYNPQGQITTETTRDMYGPNMELNAGYKKVAPVAAQAGNPMLANMTASMDDRLPAFLRQHAMTELTKGPKWKEMTLVDPQTGNKVAGLYDEGNPNPRSTWTPFGTSSEAISRSDILTLRDRGIAVPQANMPNTNASILGAPSANTPINNVPVAGNTPVTPVVAGNAPLAGNQPAIKPATNVPQTDLVKAFGYDPFKPPPPPAGLPSPEAVREFRKDQYKPLEEGKAKKVNGAAYYQDALDKYVQVINSVDLKDLANPQVRNRIDSAYNTAMLTGKNAFDLGVLNGGDERILNSLLPNYKNVSQLLVTKQTIKELAQAQKEYGTGVILKEYGSANKPVPEMYRKHIVVPKSVTPDVPAKKGGIPAGIDPAIWAVMTPQEKSLWQ